MASVDQVRDRMISQFVASNQPDKHVAPIQEQRSTQENKRSTADDSKSTSSLDEAFDQVVQNSINDLEMDSEEKARLVEHVVEGIDMEFLSDIAKSLIR